MTVASIELLVSAALRREPPAERELYQRYSPPVRSFAIRLLRDTHDAADAVQETFARAFRLLPTLPHPGEFAPWLFGIARNVCLEWLKQRKRHTRPLPHWVLTPPAVPTPEHELVGRQTTDAVMRALGGLPALRRDALRLRVEHGLSYQEIATLLGWSVAKAKVEVHRARRALDLALHPARPKTNLLAGSVAALLMLVMLGALTGAGPGELPRATASEPLPEASVCAYPALDAGGGEASSSCPPPSACFAPPPLPPLPGAEIPWSDAPVTKALEAP